MSWPGAAVCAVQSRYYDSATSAALFYEAEGRTALGTSTVTAGATGASGAGSNVIRNTDLIPTWQAIASTQATGAGAHFSHVGSFRVWARTYRPTGNTGAVSVRLEWAEGDFRRRTLNDPYNFATDEREGGFVLVDLGLVHITKAVQGTQRWEGRILAKSTVTAVALDITGPNGNTVNEWGMIDTGCDETAFPARLMPLLGISLGDCDVSGKPAMTQEGLRPNPVYLPGLEAVVAGTFPVKLTAMFPPLFQFPWIALGREDFMAQFRVTFDQRALTTTLEAHDDVEALPHEWWWTPAGGQTDARGSASD